MITLKFLPNLWSGWLAPEAISGDFFTAKSDVYSFGIILWEISERLPPFSEFPVAHSQWTSDFEEEIEKGLRPSTPNLLSFISPRRKKNGATQELSDLMSICWDARPEMRPNFDQMIPSLIEFKTAMENSQKKIKCKREKPSEEAGERSNGDDEHEYYDDDTDDEQTERPKQNPVLRPTNSLEKFVSVISGPNRDAGTNATQTTKYPLKLSDIFSPQDERKRPGAHLPLPSDRNPVIPPELEFDLVSPSPTPNPTFPLRLSEILPKPSRPTPHNSSQINLSKAIDTAEINLLRLLGSSGGDTLPNNEKETPDLNSAQTPLRTAHVETVTTPSRRKTITPSSKRSLTRKDSKNIKGSHKDKKDKEKEKEKQRGSDEVA